ncbi:FtsX-like permease family protein [Streptomyces sp. TRM43335]|uniref:FtsX-like permease family protein n=1 Tax=Streptomyces taklimakanensis TaxID=2569853 RepID=A0A6G2BEU8_9ACTN|nr:ABC transporter permease [Streptomyces taklimakanensis]MTE20801.1 FtsX-like permease family protein [Streptomyces taklimakanensis]
MRAPASKASEDAASTTAATASTTAATDDTPRAPSTPSTGPTGVTRWAADLAMGARFALSGGREGWARTVLTAIGVGLGVTVLMIAASVPNMIASRDARADARENYGASEPLEPSDHTALYGHSGTEFRGEDIRGRYIRPDGDHPPLPPGVEKAPGPDEMLVSPALRELLTSPEGELLRERLPQRIVGTIGDEGLLGPAELTYLAGSDRMSEDDGFSYRIDGFDKVGEREPLDAVLLLLVVVTCVVLLLPVGVFVATAVRFGGERRDRRLAALRLVGSDNRMVRRIAAGESLVGALLGLAVGAALFLPSREAIGEITLFDLSVFPSDVRPSALLTALIVLAVPTSAVVVTLLALRGVAIEPLGVVRGSGVRRRRLWWRLLLPAVGLLLLAPSFGGIDSGQNSIETYQITTGIVLLLVGTTAVLPWLIEWTVGRLRGGSLPLQLAVRRLQLDSGPAARAVGGITIAVAGAIAVQMLFGSAGESYTEDTGQDPTRAQMVITAETGDGEGARELTRRIGEVRGVRGTLGVTNDYVPEYAEGAEDESYTSVTVADCATLAELARVGDCEDGDAFVVPSPYEQEDTGARPGTRLNLNPPVYVRGAEEPVQTGEPDPWTVPADAREIEGRTSPTGMVVDGVLATPGALDVSRLTDARAEVMVRVDRSVPDVEEYVRNAAETGSPGTSVLELQGENRAREFVLIQRALYAGAAGVLMLIGASMVVSTLEQLRERRRLLSVLVAFGTRRSTLAWSVLWQTAVPVVLGLVLAVAGGVGLGAVLLAMTSEPFSIDWTGLAATTGTGAAVIALVTLLSLPPLWRMMRPDGLRTE